MSAAGMNVRINPILGDRIGVVDGVLWAGSVEVVERLVDAYNARPWWQKILNEFDAQEEAERQVAAAIASFEVARRDEKVAPIRRYYYGENL